MARFQRPMLQPVNDTNQQIAPISEETGASLHPLYKYITI